MPLPPLSIPTIGPCHDTHCWASVGGCRARRLAEAWPSARGESEAASRLRLLSALLLGGLRRHRSRLLELLVLVHRPLDCSVLEQRREVGHSGGGRDVDTQPGVFGDSIASAGVDVCGDEVGLGEELQPLSSLQEVEQSIGLELIEPVAISTWKSRPRCRRQII